MCDAWFRPDAGLTFGSCGGTLTVDEATEEVVRGHFDVTMPTVSPPPPPGEDPRPTRAVGTFEAWLQTPGDPFDLYSACVQSWEEM